MPLADLPQDILNRLDPLDLDRLKAFRFAVEVGGGLPGQQFLAGFDRIENLGDNVEVRDINEGGYRGVHRFPRRSNFQAIRLGRGMSLSRELYNWYQSVALWTKGKPDYRRNVSIYLIDHIMLARQRVDFEAWRWDIANAWPSEWTGPELDGMSDQIAIESVTLQHSGISEAQGTFSGQAGEIVSLFQ